MVVTTACFRHGLCSIFRVGAATATGVDRPIRTVFLLGLDGFDYEPWESGMRRSTCFQCDSDLPLELSLIVDLLLFFAPFVSHFLAGAFTDVSG
ncbi:hypothetical protein P8452_53193 [Trifolium repens]|nr:hypothetical protein P8452_53193 [Trifolium repens]